MDTGYLLIACGFVGLAIAFNLWGRRCTKAQDPSSASSIRTWVIRELHRGDLHALSDAARGRYYDLDMGQIDRLRGRGYLTNKLFGGLRVTIKGRLALLLRRTVARAKSAPEIA